MNARQIPDTISTPMTMSSTPPAMLTARMWRLTQATDPPTQPKPMATSRNGMPSPMQ